MSRQRKIYIIGFMGSGKTTAGKKLAALLGWTFADLDKMIIQKTGLPIPGIFSEHGEAFFRKTESEVLREPGSETNVVISTGGGTPCHDENMDYMLATGLTVYLKLTPPQLVSRLSGSSTERPLIKGLDKEGLLKFIEQKLAQREQFYSKAEIVVDGIDLDINRLLFEVKSVIGNM